MSQRIHLTVPQNVFNVLKVWAEAYEMKVTALIVRLMSERIEQDYEKILTLLPYLEEFKKKAENLEQEGDTECSWGDDFSFPAEERGSDRE